MSVILKQMTHINVGVVGTGWMLIKPLNNKRNGVEANGRHLMNEVERMINTWLDENIKDGRTMYPGKLAKAIEDHIIGCLIEELESFPRPDIKYPEVHRIKRIA